MRCMSTLFAAAMAASMTLAPAYAGGGDGDTDEEGRVCTAPCPDEDPSAVSTTLEPTAGSNHDLIKDVAGEVGELEGTIEYLLVWLEELDGQGGVATQYDLVSIWAAIDDLKARVKALEDEDRLSPEELAEVRTHKEQIRLLWINIGRLEGIIKGIDIPTFYMIAGPAVAASYGTPIAGVTVEAENPRDDDIVVSRGVDSFRTAGGLNLGFGWEDGKGGMLLSGRILKVSDSGFGWGFSGVRYARLGESWALGLGAGVVGNSYELFDGHNAPGSVEIGGEVIGLARYSIEIDDEKATALDVMIQTSCAVLHQANPQYAAPGVVGGLNLGLAIRF